MAGRQWSKGSETKISEPEGGYPQVYPWDAMLTEVKRSAYRVGYLDLRAEKCVERESELRDEADPNDPMVVDVRKELAYWLKESRNERKHLAMVAHRAIAAGFAERVVRGIELEVTTLTTALGRAMDAADLTSEQRERARDTLIHEIEAVAVQRGYHPDGVEDAEVVG